MRNQALDKSKTGAAVQDAIAEIQHAIRPHKRSISEGLSWLFAVATGAAVVWQGFKAGREKEEAEQATALAQPLPLPAESVSGIAEQNVASEHARERRTTAIVAPPEETVPAEKVKVSGPLAMAKEFYTRFNEDECPTRAAALAFTGIFSLIPLLLVALAALGSVIQDPQQAAEYVRRFITQMLPGEEAARAANEVIRQANIVEAAQGLMKGSVWAAAGGILSLIWTAVSLFVTASVPMNAAWDVKETRSFIQLRLVCLGVFAGAGLLFVLSLLPSSGPDFVRNLHIPWLGLPEDMPFWVAGLFSLLAIAIDIAMFVLIYWFLPNAPVTWRAALFGGAVAGLLWEAFKKGFAIYLAHFGNFNKLYGAFGGVALLITWIWYSCIVLLAGAILCKMYHERLEEGGVAQKRRNT